jgi:hypothetical protein
MKNLILLFLIFIVINCDPLYTGKIVEKNKIDGYYRVVEDNDYDTHYKNESYRDSNGVRQTRMVSYEEYTGSTFIEVYVYPSYSLKIAGWTRKENKKEVIIYVEENKYKYLELGTRLIIREKANKWYQLDNYLYNQNPINERVVTGRRIYLGSDYQSRNRQDFYNNILPVWKKERKQDTYKK